MPKVPSSVRTRLSHSPVEMLRRLSDLCLVAPPQQVEAVHQHGAPVVEARPAEPRPEDPDRPEGEGS